jgi:hypothetical protein
MGIGGQRHDLDELARDQPLQEWMRARPALIKLSDGTLAQHCGSDSYAALLEKSAEHPIEAINARVHELLSADGEQDLWDVLSGRNVLPTQPERLDRWLELTRSRRVVFGHNPHRSAGPEIYHGGKALNFDGGFSRFHMKFRRHTPVGATVAPLPPVGD